MRLKLLLALLAFTIPASAADNPVFDEAFHRMYNFDFPSAHQVIDPYVAAHPNEAFGYTIEAASYLYSELDRLGILETEFFESDKNISDARHKLKPDPKAHDLFYEAINHAQSLSQATLDKNPKDPEALFTLCLTLGELSDYMALVEKHQVASLSVTKRSYRLAKELLAIDGSYIDAYLTTGFTEYLVGSLPVVVRWFVKFDDVQGDKEKGFKTLQLVAEKGHYLKGLAKILMATGYVREKKPAEAKKLLADLTREYPGNPLLRREYQKISARVHDGS